MSSFCKNAAKNFKQYGGCQAAHKALGSVGTNYIGANEKLGDKDFLMRPRIARKEAKEAQYWLKLLKDLNNGHKAKAQELIIEAVALRKILSSIIIKKSS